MNLKKQVTSLFLLLGICHTALACSSFVLKNGKTVILGKNFDWTFDQGYVVKNLRNIEKFAYYSHNGIAASWTSKYGSFTFNQNGKEMPYGGMNERGLVVEMLWLEDTRFNISEDKPFVNELEWIQYQLDNFQTVDEVIANTKNLKIYPIKGKIHYILADATGKSVIIEYLDGKPNIYDKEANTCQAITNKTVVQSEKYKEDLQDIPKRNTSDMYRYYQLESKIRQLHEPKDISEKTAFDMLKQVSIAKGELKTVWSIVYNIEAKSIYFYTHSHRKIKQINLTKADFDEIASCHDINQDAETILDDNLIPISDQINHKMASASLQHLGFDEGFCKDLSQHQMNQKSSLDSYFANNYFHFDIGIPLEEAGKRLLFAVMDSEENFQQRKAVKGGYAMGTTSIGIVNRHIYGLKYGLYSMIALIDENRNSQLDFDNEGHAIEKYATFSDFAPKSLQEITFQNTSGYFDKTNGKYTVKWR